MMGNRDDGNRARIQIILDIRDPQKNREGRKRDIKIKRKIGVRAETK